MATVYYALYGAMQPLYGLLSDRLGRVRVMRVALGGMAVADLLSAVAPTLPLLTAGRAATGALAGAIVPASLVYIGDTVAFRIRQQAIVDLMAAVAAGTTAATVVAGILAHFASWRLAFAVPGGLAAVLTVAIGRMPEPARTISPDGLITRVTRVLRRPAALALIGLGIYEGVVLIGYLVYLAPALQARGYNPAAAGLVVAGFGLSVFAGTRVVKRIAHRVPPPALIGMGGGMLVLGYLAAAINQDVPGILAAALTAGGTFAFMHSTLQAWATDLAPEARGTSTSLFVTGVFAGGAIGTASAAGLAGAHRFPALFLLGAVLTVPLTLLCAAARSRYVESAPLAELPVVID